LALILSFRLRLPPTGAIADYFVPLGVWMGLDMCGVMKTASGCELPDCLVLSHLP